MNAENFSENELPLTSGSTNSFGEDASSKDDVNNQLISAVCHGDDKKVEELLKKGAAPNTKYHYSNSGSFDSCLFPLYWDGTVLHLAIQQEDQNIIKLLITNGADVNASCTRFWQNEIDFWITKTEEDVTPIVFAIESRQWDIVSFLIQSGADINKVSTAVTSGLDYPPQNYSVLDYALMENVPQDIIDLLKSNGVLTYKDNQSSRKRRKEITMTKKLVGKVTPEQRDEIQALYERRNALKELFIVVPKDNQNLYERVAADMAQTQKKFDQWWSDIRAQYNCEDKKCGLWEINFDTCEIFLSENCSEPCENCSEKP